MREVYPRVSKPELRMLLEMYGLKGRCTEMLFDLHESTNYKEVVRVKLEASILFNIFSIAVMR